MAPKSIHQAQFYDEGEYPDHSIANFLASGLMAGDSAVIIATPEHVRAIRARLAFQIKALQDLEKIGCVTIFDAQAVLKDFVDGKSVDWSRADSILETVVDRAMTAAPSGRAQVFGELVALLSGQGNIDAAIELERKWNALLRARPIKLLCAYPLHPFWHNSRSEPFTHICDEHDTIVPVMSRLDGTTELGRSLALLQQRVGTLELEIAERKNAEAELRASRAGLRALAAHMQTAREQERAALARELHDEFAQSLASAKMEVRRIAKQIDCTPVVQGSDRVAALKTLNAFAVTVDDLVDSVRTIVSGLRLDLLDEVGLGAAVEWQVHKFEESTDIPCALRSGIEKLDWDRNRSIRICRVLQESLLNVAQHADATRVDVRLEMQQQCLRLLVRDNGRGIRASETRKPGRFGILDIRERLLLLGGKMQIRGKPGQGTVVSVRVPVPRGRALKEPVSAVDGNDDLRGSDRYAGV